MNKILIIFAALTGFAVLLSAFPESGVAVTVTVVFSFLIMTLIRRFDKDNEFLVNIFLAALILRIIFGTVIHVFELREFFGADAITFDFLGNRLVEIWTGQLISNDFLSQRALSTSSPGWGMNYLTGILYLVFGRNILAAQFFCAVIGAATAPMIYICSFKVFQNHRVGKVSAILVAFSPAFVIWSAQLMKDGLIIFLLVLAITMVLQIQQKFSYQAIAILVLTLFGIISLRFYIFYMVAVAVVGSFVIGTSSSVKSIVRGIVTLAVVGVILTYLGILQTAGTNFETFGNLERIQISRQGMADTAESGFGADVDVSTTEGAIFAVPVGFVYLMFAPFPWQVANFRQAITLPEMIVWWASFPLLLYGLGFTLKNRLRGAMSILIFTLLLTIAYSIFQGNVGTAYRQRAQIQVFLFIFIAVGWSLFKERREIRDMSKGNRRKPR